MDKGEREADAVLDGLEKELQGVYAQSAKELNDKACAMLKEYGAENARMAEAVKSGSMTDEAYRKWRADYAADVSHLRGLINVVTAHLVNSNKVAAAMMMAARAQAFTAGANFGTWQVAAMGYDMFKLYSADTVARLMVERPKLFPDVDLDEKKDRRWNMQKTRSALVQGIIQGEGVDGIADRLKSVVGMNHRSATLRARTMVTAAQNGGRQQAYTRAAEMGISVEKRWLAAVDMRTRASHVALDGECVAIDYKFSNDLKYPGDPSSNDFGEVCNCRCTMVPVIDGEQYEDVNRPSKIGGMTYEEWRAERGS